MRAGIQGLSWYVRRLPDCDQAGYFYRDDIGLPVIAHLERGWAAETPDPLWVYHGGDFVQFELLFGARERPQPERLEDQDEIPVFRTFDLDVAVAAVLRGGGRILPGGQDEPAGRTAWFADPAGRITGLRETSPTSIEPADVLARERNAAGAAELHGVPPMPDTVFDIGWVRMHVVDVAAQLAFYRDVVGLDVLDDQGADGATLWLGTTSRLELRPGGAVQPRPADRGESPEMWMLRVHDIDGIVGALKDHGVHFVNEPWYFMQGHITYVVDPENHLIGLQQHDVTDAPQEQLAWRRWQETQAAQQA